VGCIYTTTVSTNPATVFGFGTWTAFGAGRVLVGLDSGQTEFDTVEETGGAKTVTLTAAQSGLPQHTHIQNSHNHTQDAHGHTISGGSSDDTSAPFTGPDASTSTATAFGGGIGSTVATNQAATAVNQDAGPTDASSAHNNLQPYIVVYFFKRTA
jgi:microcystin-dependent protein